MPLTGGSLCFDIENLDDKRMCLSVPMGNWVELWNSIFFCLNKFFWKLKLNSDAIFDLTAVPRPKNQILTPKTSHLIFLTQILTQKLFPLSSPPFTLKYDQLKKIISYQIIINWHSLKLTSQHNLPTSRDITIEK